MRMKRFLALMLALLMTAALGACSGGTPAEKVDIYSAADEMAAATELPEMLVIKKGDSKEERGFAAISDLGYDKVEDFWLSYSADGSAYELAIVLLKDEADAAALESSLKDHIRSRTEQYRYYDAEQVPRAESAVVALSGRCAALIMCDDVSAVKAVFDKAFG